MPLVIVTGLPCSGKSYRASQIAEAFNSRLSSDPTTNGRRSVLHVPSNHAGLDYELATTFATSEAASEGNNLSNPFIDLRESIYTAAAAEKTARAEEFSAIKRALHKDVVVIADSLNYIKGYRYQLWCEAKAAGTRCCVVHVAAQQDEVEKWNRERLRAWGRDFESDESKTVDVDHEASKDRSTALVGRDVKGDLMPESHTAIYGDRTSTGPRVSRSRSSSTDNLSEEEPRRAVEDDGMTLKSLYLRVPETDAASEQQPHNTFETSSISQTSANTTSASSLFPTDSVVTTQPPGPQTTPPYTPSTLDSLIMRYEPPSPFSRWDTPLFTVPTTDVEPPYLKIWEACFPPAAKPMSKKALSQSQNRHLSPETSLTAKDNTIKQHAATILPAATSAEALQTLESGTAEIVAALSARATEIGILGTDTGGTLRFTVPRTSTTTTNHRPTTHETSSAGPELEIILIIPMGTLLTQPILQRLRRKYTALQRGGIAHGKGHVRGRDNVVLGFARFLSDEFAED